MPNPNDESATLNKELTVQNLKQSMALLADFLNQPAVQRQQSQFLKQKNAENLSLGYGVSFAQGALEAFAPDEVFALGGLPPLPEEGISDLESFHPQEFSNHASPDGLNRPNTSLNELTGPLKQVATEEELTQFLKNNEAEREKAMTLMVSLISYHSDLKNNLSVLDDKLNNIAGAPLPALGQQFSVLIQHAADLDMLFREFNQHFNTMVGGQEFTQKLLIDFFRHFWQSRLA